MRLGHTACTPGGEKGKQSPVPRVKRAGGTPAVRKAKASNVRHGGIFLSCKIRYNLGCGFLIWLGGERCQLPCFWLVTKSWSGKRSGGFWRRTLKSSLSARLLIFRRRRRCRTT